MHERAENGRMVLHFFTSYRDTLSRLLSLIPFSILFCTRHYDGSLLSVFEKGKTLASPMTKKRHSSVARVWSVLFDTRRRRL